METGWTLVYTVGNDHQAEMAKILLAEQEIDAIVINKRDSSYLAFGDIEIFVKEAEAEKAAEILKKSAI